VLTGACRGDAPANRGVGPAKKFSRLTTGVVVHDDVYLVSWCHNTHRERRAPAREGRICLAAVRGLQMVCSLRGSNKVAAGRNDAYNARTEIARARARDSKEPAVSIVRSHLSLSSAHDARRMLWISQWRANHIATSKNANINSLRRRNAMQMPNDGVNHVPRYTQGAPIQ
jgi:hypothetical protein